MLKKKMKKLFVLGVSLSLLVSPFIAAAQLGADSPPALDEGQITDYGTLMDKIGSIGSYMLGILLAIAVIFLIFAAFTYLTSGGEEKATTKAKNYIIYAVVAIAIGLLARGLVEVVRQFVLA